MNEPRAADRLLAQVERFAVTTKATPSATADTIGQMIRIALPDIEAEAVTAYKESLTKTGRTIMSLARVQEDTADAQRYRSLAADGDYETWVRRVADAIHQSCLLDWEARRIADPERQFTQHMADAHYGMAHDLVRRLPLA